MYCENCGQKASGNFCAHCGHPLDIPEVLPVLDWSQEVEYATIIKFPDVKDLIARNASQARKTISGEQFLEIYDKVFSPPVSLKKVAEITAPLYAKMGIQTGKSRSGQLPVPAGKVIVAILCSLARNGRAIKQVHQCSDGCIIHAALPSDLFSLEGELVITVHRHREGTQVEAATRIPGQLYDWGKSTRCLNHLFDELGSAA